MTGVGVDNAGADFNPAGRRCDRSPRTEGTRKNAVFRHPETVESQALCGLRLGDVISGIHVLDANTNFSQFRHTRKSPVMSVHFPFPGFVINHTMNY